MNFNYIVGNPPFQSGTLESNGKKLYLPITEKMEKLYINEMIFLTPTTIANKKIKRFSLTDIDNVKTVNYDVNKYFNIGVDILLFHLDKTFTDDTNIVYDNIIYKVAQHKPKIKQSDIIPTILFNRIKNKGSKQENKLFIGDVTSNNSRFANKSNVAKYKIHINTLKNKIAYTDVKPKLYKKKKLVVHMGKTYNKNNCLISTENFGQYQNMIDIDNLSDIQIENLKSFLFNNISINICKKFRDFYKTGFNNIIYFFH